MSIGVHEIKPRCSRLINQCNSDFNNNHAALSEHSVAIALIRYHDNNVITRSALTNLSFDLFFRRRSAEDSLCSFAPRFTISPCRFTIYGKWDSN